MDVESPQGCSKARTGQYPPEATLGGLMQFLKPCRDQFDPVGERFECCHQICRGRRRRGRGNALACIQRLIRKKKGREQQLADFTRISNRVARLDCLGIDQLAQSLKMRFLAVPARDLVVVSTDG